MEELVSWAEYLTHFQACRSCSAIDSDECEGCKHETLRCRPRCPKCESDMVYASEGCKEDGMVANKADYLCLACGFNLKPYVKHPGKAGHNEDDVSS